MNPDRYEVAKIGGWSLGSGERTKAAMSYVLSNQEIHYVVPSAPEGVTNLLIACLKSRKIGQSFDEDFDKVRTIYEGVGRDYGYYGLSPLLNEVEALIAVASGSERDRHLIPSRGEWLEGHMLADLSNFRFIDPTEIIGFRKNGQIDERSYPRIRSRLRGGDRFVIPGFYGLGPDGEVYTFPRNGSDVTGAVIARGVNASLYRNMTSVDGVFSADPRIVPSARLIETLTFEEYRELGNGGTKVLHRDTIIPVASAGIPINVRHSKKPESFGTMVVARRPKVEGEGVIGIAGKAGFVSLNVHKYGMNDEKGFESRVLQIIRRCGISIEHTPTGTDWMSVIFSEDQLTGQEDQILDQITRKIRPTRREFKRGIGFLSVVGQGINNDNSRVSGRLFSALDEASIRHSGSTQGVSNLSITVFVDGARVNDAIKAAHRVLVEGPK